MAKLKPRRGKDVDAADIVLARGEVFFGYTANGIGTGYGRIKMGNGTTKYLNLAPSFIEIPNGIGIGFTNSTTIDNNSLAHLNNIIPSNNLVTIFTNLKQLLLNFNGNLNNVIYKNAANLTTGYFKLNAKYGTLIIPDHAPSSPSIGSIWWE